MTAGMNAGPPEWTEVRAQLLLNRLPHGDAVTHAAAIHFIEKHMLTKDESLEKFFSVQKMILHFDDYKDAARERLDELLGYFEEEHAPLRDHSAQLVGMLAGYDVSVLRRLISLYPEEAVVVHSKLPCRVSPSTPCRNQPVA